MLRPLIAQQLVIGPQPVSLYALKDQGITAIVDLNQNTVEQYEAKRIGLEYWVDLKLRIADNYEPIGTEVLEHIITVLDKLIAAGHYVYLHCTAAYGRSPTVAAAYLISLGLTIDKAIQQVKSVRPQAWQGLDERYRGSLEEFARKTGSIMECKDDR
jgi:protein-tyrosine phosphatase